MIGVTTFSWSEFAFTLHFLNPFEQCIRLLACGGTASKITEGEDETNSKQETSFIYWLMQGHSPFCYTKTKHGAPL